jgi:hypothetical protein
MFQISQDEISAVITIMISETIQHLPKYMPVEKHIWEKTGTFIADHSC